MRDRVQLRADGGFIAFYSSLSYARECDRSFNEPASPLGAEIFLTSPDRSTGPIDGPKQKWVKPF